MTLTLLQCCKGLRTAVALSTASCFPSFATDTGRGLNIERKRDVKKVSKLGTPASTVVKALIRPDLVGR